MRPPLNLVSFDLVQLLVPIISAGDSYIVTLGIVAESRWLKRNLLIWLGVLVKHLKTPGHHFNMSFLIILLLFRLISSNRLRGLPPHRSSNRHSWLLPLFGFWHFNLLLSCSLFNRSAVRHDPVVNNSVILLEPFFISAWLISRLLIWSERPTWGRLFVGGPYDQVAGNGLFLLLTVSILVDTLMPVLRFQHDLPSVGTWRRLTLKIFFDVTSVVGHRFSLTQDRTVAIFVWENVVRGLLNMFLESLGFRSFSLLAEDLFSGFLLVFRYLQRPCFLGVQLLLKTYVALKLALSFSQSIKFLIIYLRLLFEFPFLTLDGRVNHVDFPLELGLLRF